MKQNPLFRAFQKRPGQLSPTRVIVGSFCGVILVGALLLMLPFSTRDGQIGLVDAVFTATSCTCVTGLVVFDTFSKFTPFGQGVILALIQVGGLGLVTLTSFVSMALHRRVGFRSMMLASESVGSEEAAGAKRLLYLVVRTSLGFELCGAVLLMGAMVPRFGLQGVWFSVFTAVSAFCNAGFDLFGALSPYSSLTAFAGNWYVLAVVMLLIVSGGLGFIVWQDLFALPRQKKLSLHSKLVLVTTGLLLLVGAVGIGAMEWDNPATMGGMGVGGKLLSSLFQSVTCRTAGFNSIDQAGMHSISKLFSALLMFIGAAPAGTGGGVKTTTFTVILLAVAAVLRGREDPVLRGRRIEKKTVYRALSIVVLGFLMMVTAALVMIFTTPSRGGMIDGNLIDCLYEAASAFGTAGLSVGVTAQLSTAGKLFTALTMLVGRVGPIAMGTSLARELGELSRREILPEAKIMVG